MKGALIFLILLLIPSLSMGKDTGSSREEIFSLSNLALVDGRYDEAVSGYGKIVEMGIENPDVYYNIGNAFAKSGKPGKAILYYEKSLKLSGADEDLLHNLNLVRGQLSLSSQALDARSPLEKVSGFITFKGAADFALFLYILTFSLLIALTLNLNGRIIKRLRTMAAVTALFTLVCGMLTGYKLYKQERSFYAVVVAEIAELYEVPLEQGEVTGSLNEGVKVRLIADDKGWYKISAASEGTVGWVRAESVGVI